MKWRPFLIVLFSILSFILMVLVYMWGVSAGAMMAAGGEWPQPGTSDSTTTEDPIKFVKAAPVENRNYLVEVSSLGRVSSAQAISLAAEVQGVLKAGSIGLKKGNSFRKGQVLFRIENSDAHLLLKSRKSSYLTILANTLPDIKIDYPEHYEVWLLFFESVDLDKPLPPMPPLVEPKLKTLLASRNILSEYYNIKADQVKLSKYVVTAPFNGTITDAFADVGAIVSPGVAVLNIINNGSLEVECPVSPEEIDLVKIGAAVSLSDDQNQWAGSVIRKGQYLNPNTQSIPVFIQLKSGDEGVYNGMYLTATISGDSVNNVFQVPRRSLIENKSEVYVEQDSMLLRRAVDVVLLREETALIGGLEEGTNVITEPIINPRDSMKISVIR